DQRLEQQRRQSRADRLGLDPEVRPKPVLEPHLLDFEVKLQRLDFLRQRHLGGRLIGQRVAKERRQSREHRVRALGLLEQHQGRDRIQRVEQEVRVELIAQHRQLRAGGLPLEPLALTDLVLEQEEIIDPVIQRRPSGEQREVEQDPAEILDPFGLEAGIDEGRNAPHFDDRECRRGEHHGGERQHQGEHRPKRDQAPEQRGHQQGQRIARGGQQQSMDDEHPALAVGESRNRPEEEITAPADRLEDPEGAVLIVEERLVDAQAAGDRCRRRANVRGFCRRRAPPGRGPLVEGRAFGRHRRGYRPAFRQAQGCLALYHRSSRARSHLDCGTGVPDRRSHSQLSPPRTRMKTISRVAPLAAIVLLLAGCQAGEKSAPQNTAATAVAPVLTTPDAVDTHSFARPLEARVTHVALDLDVDFDARRLGGTARIDIDRRPGAKEIVLDDNGLEIDGVTDAAKHALPWKVGTKDSNLGAPLVIALRPDTRRIIVTYKSAASAGALLWLTSEQTAGKKAPFLFSQGESIENRSWIPTQDSPGIRQSWEATIHVPAGMTAVMSAPRAEQPITQGGESVFSFRMAHSVAPYMIAIAVGDLAFKPLGPRTGVWAEPVTLNAAARELAHSWSGNLATNATWNDFWLNEGMTTYAERRIVEELYGKKVAEEQIALGIDALNKAVEEAGGPNSPDTRLHLDLKGRHPD